MIKNEKGRKKQKQLIEVKGPEELETYFYIGLVSALKTQGISGIQNSPNAIGQALKESGKFVKRNYQFNIPETLLYERFIDDIQKYGIAYVESPEFKQIKFDVPDRESAESYLEQIIKDMGSNKYKDMFLKASRVFINEYNKTVRNYKKN